LAGFIDLGCLGLCCCGQEEKAFRAAFPSEFTTAHAKAEKISPDCCPRQHTSEAHTDG